MNGAGLNALTQAGHPGSVDGRARTPAPLVVRVRTLVLAGASVITALRIAVATLPGAWAGLSSGLTLVAVASACFLIATRRRPEALLGLVLLLLPESGIVGAAPVPGSILSAVAPDFDVGGQVADVGGLTVALAGVIVGPAVAWRDRALLPPSLRQLFLPWAVAVVFGAVAAYLGWQAGYETWSLGLRIPLSVGVLFWGARFALLWPETKWLTATLIGASALVIGGLLGGHLLFVAAGLCGAVAGSRSLAVRGYGIRLLAGLAGLVAATVTWTTAGIVLVAGAISSLSSTRGRVSPSVAVPAVLSALALAGALVGMGASSVEGGRGSSLLSVTALGPGTTSVTDKLFLDRGPLWAAAIADIRSSNPFMVAAGRPLKVHDYPTPGLTQEWGGGAHNSGLEVFRQVGLVGGLVLLAVITAALLQLARVVWRSPSGSAPAIMSATGLGVVIVGATTGQFPITEPVGLVLWAAIGFAMVSKVGFRCGGDANARSGEGVEE